MFCLDLKIMAVMTKSTWQSIVWKRSCSILLFLVWTLSYIVFTWFLALSLLLLCFQLPLPPALERPKQALRGRGPSPVSVYRTAQCAGDSNYQQMTVAVPNVDQMVIQGIMYCMYGCEGDWGLAKGKIKQKEDGSKDTLGTKHVSQHKTTRWNPHFETA